MRKLFIITGMICAAFLALSSRSPVGEEIPETAGEAVLPLRMARLYMAEPDQKLAMPVAAVRVRRVSDT